MTNSKKAFKIGIFDILGREITNLLNEFKPAGRYEILFEAGNLPSGVYLYRVKTDKYSETKKMIIVKLGRILLSLEHSNCTVKIVFSSSRVTR